MIAQSLHIAILETIQTHADQHRNGVLDVDVILAGLISLTAQYLAEIPNPSKRKQAFNNFCICIADRTNELAGQSTVSAIHNS